MIAFQPSNIRPQCPAFGLEPRHRRCPREVKKSAVSQPAFAPVTGRTLRLGALEHAEHGAPSTREAHPAHAEEEVMPILGGVNHGSHRPQTVSSEGREETQARQTPQAEASQAAQGYHKSPTLAECTEWDVRTYIPEPERGKRTWTDKPPSWRVATTANRHRVKGERGKRSQKKRSELVERSFTQVCETDGGRRTWLRGRVNVSKRYRIQVAAFNLGVVMRTLLGVGKPRVLQGLSGAFSCSCCGCGTFWSAGSPGGMGEGPSEAHRLR
jgi:hypothetical protein